MAWSQDEEQMLAMIERHLTDEDPKLAARLQSLNHRVGRGRQRSAAHTWLHGPRPSTLIIVVSWLLIAILFATLLIMAIRENATALPA